jgi:hypothetical protein
VRKNGTLRRIRDLVPEKTRGWTVQRACKSVALAGKVFNRVYQPM